MTAPYAAKHLAALLDSLARLGSSRGGSQMTQAARQLASQPDEGTR